MEEFTIGTRVLYHRNGIKYIGTILERDECYAVVKFDNPHALYIIVCHRIYILLGVPYYNSLNSAKAASTKSN